MSHNGEINTLRGNKNWMSAEASPRASAATRSGSVLSEPNYPTQAVSTTWEFLLMSGGPRVNIAHG